MDKAYTEAFAEVDQILKLMPVDLLSKIPASFRQIISENKAENYKVKIEEPLENQNLKEETVVILGLIYRDFLASPEEREELQQKDAEELKKLEEELQEQYDIQNVFQKRKVKKEKEISDEEILNVTDLTLYKKPNFVQKIFNLVKGFFKKNNF